MLLYLLEISKKVITSWTFGRREKMLTLRLLIQTLTMVVMQLLFFLFLHFQVLVRIFLTHAM